MKEVSIWRLCGLSEEAVCVCVRARVCANVHPGACLGREHQRVGVGVSLLFWCLKCV